jgi:hypothetical protein
MKKGGGSMFESIGPAPKPFPLAVKVAIWIGVAITGVAGLLFLLRPLF